MMAPATIPPQYRPFYSYEGKRIYLRVDSTRITIVADHPLERARAVLGSAVPVAPGQTFAEFSVLDLPAGTSLSEAVKAVRALRASKGVDFVSNTYHLDEPGHAAECLLGLPPRFAVTFVDGTPRSYVDRLNRRLGVDGGPMDPRFSPATGWLMRYPRGSTATPLEIVEFYRRQPKVVFADPDMFGCLELAGEPAKRRWNGQDNPHAPTW